MVGRKPRDYISVGAWSFVALDTAVTGIGGALMAEWICVYVSLGRGIVMELDIN